MDVNKKISNDELNILREKYKDDNVMCSLLDKDWFIEDLGRACNANVKDAERMLDAAQKEWIAFPDYFNEEYEQNNKKSAHDIEWYINSNLRRRYEGSHDWLILAHYTMSKYEDSVGKSWIRAYAYERAEKTKLADHFGTLNQKYELECYDKEFLKSLHAVASILDIPFAREITNMDDERVIDYNLNDKLVLAYLEEYPMNGYLLSKVCDTLGQEIDELRNNIPENMLNSRDKNGSIRDVLGTINSKLEEISKTSMKIYDEHINDQTKSQTK